MASGKDKLPRVGISSCLLGEKVRYDGADKRDPMLLEALRDRVEWVPVCPEVEVGMGTPREPVQLVRAGDRIRMVTVNTEVDYTASMITWANRRLSELARLQIAGYVLKKNSPSCGTDVKVLSAEGETSARGRGLFADALIHRFPGLPIEEEDALHEAATVERFLQRVHAYHRHHIR